MEDRGELVKLSARIWRAHHRQESLCKSLMCMDISCELRKLCSKGHMSAILFKKEIKQVYESFKCTFSDGDLNSITRIEDVWNPENACEETILRMLVTEQNHLIKFYETALSQLTENRKLSALCRDHLGHLKELNRMFSEKDKIERDITHQYEKYGSVA